MIAVNTSPFHLTMQRRLNVWYSVKDGNWNDPTVWQSNRSKKAGIPQVNDTVYIKHVITCTASITTGNLYVSGTFKFNSGSLTLTVNGDLQAVGTVDQSAGANTIILNGYNNFIINYIPGTSSTVQYNSNYAQGIMPINYYNLNLFGGIGSVKYLIANLSVAGTFKVGCTLDSKGYDISVSGSTTPTVYLANIISTTGIIFNGGVIGGGFTSLNIIGGANIEIRSGINIGNVSWDWSNTNVSFTTNNQNISLGGGATLTLANITVVGAITIATASGSAALIINGTLNGTTSTSTFNNNAYIQFNTSVAQMSTGIFNYRNSSNSTISYNFSGTYTLPFTSYENLVLNGGNTKYLGGDTIIYGSLSIGITATIFELLSYNLSVGGITTVTTFGSALKKSGPGNVIFGGIISLNTGAISSDFSGGNPSIEFRGGLAFNNGAFNFGSGNLSFTTNNQTLTSGAGNSITFNGNTIIASGITLTKISDGNNVVFNGYVNGVDSTSTYLNNGITIYNNSQQPMQTGLLNCNISANSFYYSLNGNQDITPGIYRNLTLNIGGTKKLLGNTSVLNTYILSAPATINNNGFSLTNP